MRYYFLNSSYEHANPLLFPPPEVFIIRKVIPEIVVVIWHEKLISSRVDDHLGHSEAIEIGCSEKLNTLNPAELIFYTYRIFLQCIIPRGCDRPLDNTYSMGPQCQLTAA